MNNHKNIYIGAMSGTSFDAIDISIIEIENNIILKSFYSKQIPSSLKKRIKKIIESESATLVELGQLNKKVGLLFAQAINEAIKGTKLTKNRISCVAISGQTIRHEVSGTSPFSMQIGDPNIVSSETGLTVISDFRNTHISLGGEGAPLVPECHNALFYSPKKSKIVLNIGGIANYSYIENKGDIWGSDVGPGNALMDAYCQKYLNKPYDKDGKIASKGNVNTKELNKLLSNKFFKKKFPKSTGKELFNLNILSKEFLKESPENILATLTEYTALSILKAIKINKHIFDEFIVCGGGSKNKFLLARIAAAINNKIILSNDLGYDIQAVESIAFAWIGYKRINNQAMKVQLGKNKFKKGLLGSITKSIP
jgi:anhydro-N-acetylmuramic acid kinase